MTVHRESGTTSTPVQQRELSVDQTATVSAYPSVDRSANPVVTSTDGSAPGSTQVADDGSTHEATDEAVPPQRPAGDPRALLAARLLASGALFISAFIHARLALKLGLGGSLISQGQLFAATALISAFLAVALLTSNKRVWLFAVVLSVSGLGAVLASVYSPLPSVGPLPSINEQEWFLTKVIAAFAEASVPVLWLIRQIAPPADPEALARDEGTEGTDGTEGEVAPATA